MTAPYRDYISMPMEKAPNKDNYSYVLRDNYACPICRNIIDKNNYTTLYNSVQHCYPFRRLLIRGSFWWRKYCPIDGIHYHVKCKKCNIKWIVMSDEVPNICEVVLN